MHLGSIRFPSVFIHHEGSTKKKPFQQISMQTATYRAAGRASAPTPVVDIKELGLQEQVFISLSSVKFQNIWFLRSLVYIY